jgi:hypothetical protein
MKIDGPQFVFPCCIVIDFVLILILILWILFMGNSVVNCDTLEFAVPLVFLTYDRMDLTQVHVVCCRTYMIYMMLTRMFACVFIFPFLRKF